MLSDFSAGTSVVVNALLPEWPRSQPKDGSPIRIDLAAVAGRVDEILRDNKDADPELLIKAAEMYLGETRQFYRAPQFFFGPANGNEAPWVAYARMVIHREHQTEEVSVRADGDQTESRPTLNWSDNPVLIELDEYVGRPGKQVEFIDPKTGVTCHGELMQILNDVARIKQEGRRHLIVVPITEVKPVHVEASQ